MRASRTTAEPVDVAAWLAGEVGGRRAYFVPNRGNAGDAMIALASWQIFARKRLDVVTVRDPLAFDARGKVVIHGGGGNLVPAYEDAAVVLSRIHAQASRLILLPQTVDGHGELLASFGPNVTVFCRERISGEYVRRAAPRAEMFLAHDLGLELDVDSAMRPSTLHRARAAAGLARWTVSRSARCRGRGREALARIVAPPPSPRPGGGKGTLHAFRTDCEKTEMEIPEDNIDVSERFAFGTTTMAAAWTSTRDLLAYLAPFALVRTNRLHVAIAAALMGRSVELYPNSYFKCRAAYEFSLRARFPGLRWVDVPGQDSARVRAVAAG